MSLLEELSKIDPERMRVVAVSCARKAVTFSGEIVDSDRIASKDYPGVHSMPNDIIEAIEGLGYDADKANLVGLGVAMGLNALRAYGETEMFS